MENLFWLWSEGQTHGRGPRTQLTLLVWALEEGHVSISAGGLYQLERTGNAFSPGVSKEMDTMILASETHVGPPTYKIIEQ